MRNLLLQEEIYHLVDLLEMNIKETPNKILLSDIQKQEAVIYDEKLIKKLNELIDEKAV